MDDTLTFNVLDIVTGTTVDGPGLRTSVYLAGCSHHCRDCHNPQSWDASGGNPTTLPKLMERVLAERFDVTLTGGDPLMNPEATAALIREIKSHGLGVWLYTGYTVEQILANPRLLAAAAEADAVVEGPFVESLRDTDLQFRGSSNQRIVCISLTSGKPEVSPWTSDWDSL